MQQYLTCPKSWTIINARHVIMWEEVNISCTYVLSNGGRLKKYTQIMNGGP